MGPPRHIVSQLASRKHRSSQKRSYRAIVAAVAIVLAVEIWIAFVLVCWASNNLLCSRHQPTEIDDHPASVKNHYYYEQTSKKRMKTAVMERPVFRFEIDGWKTILIVETFFWEMELLKPCT